MIFFKVPSFLSAPSSRIVSIASSFADWINPQVFTTAISASPGSVTSSYPFFLSFASILSESTRFFEHPSDTIPTFIGILLVLLYIFVLFVLKVFLYGSIYICKAVAVPYKSVFDFFYCFSVAAVSKQPAVFFFKQIS